MQQDVDTVGTALAIRIFGVNEAGEESGNQEMCTGRTLPWLQDLPIAAASAWRLWHVTERDLVILDKDNKVVRVYNLTEHDLRNAGNYTELRAILLGAAGHDPPPSNSLTLRD